MKRAALVAFALSLPVSAFATDGLLTVPDNRVARPRPVPGYTDSAGRSNAPSGGADTETFVRYLKSVREPNTKAAIANTVKNWNPSVPCLPSHQAFFFEKVNDTEYKVNCLAKKRDGVQAASLFSVVDFHVVLDFGGDLCTNDERLRGYFGAPGNRNKSAAESLARQCMPIVKPKNPSQVVVKTTAVTTEFAREQADKPGNSDLKAYVSGNRNTKSGSSSRSGNSVNPLRQGGSAF